MSKYGPGVVRKGRLLRSGPSVQQAVRPEKARLVSVHLSPRTGWGQEQDPVRLHFSVYTLCTWEEGDSGWVLPSEGSQVAM